jgi:hypothetical protein
LLESFQQSLEASFTTRAFVEHEIEKVILPSFIDVMMRWQLIIKLQREREVSQTEATKELTAVLEDMIDTKFSKWAKKVQKQETPQLPDPVRQPRLNFAYFCLSFLSLFLSSHQKGLICV